MIKPHFIAGGPPETPISYAKLGVKSREIEDPSQPHRVSAPHPPWGCMGGERWPVQSCVDFFSATIVRRSFVEL